MSGVLKRSPPGGEHGGTGFQVRDPSLQPALTCKPSSSDWEHPVNERLDYDAFMHCVGRGSIMSHLIKSGCRGGKRGRGEARLHLYWLLDVG